MGLDQANKVSGRDIGDTWLGLKGGSAVFMPPHGRGVPPGRGGISPAPAGGW